MNTATTKAMGPICGSDRMRVAAAETESVQYMTARAPILSDSTPP